MKVVNIVPVEMVEVAKTRMISALDWSLQRWNEEGKGAERTIDVETIIERAVLRRRANEPNDDDEEEEEEEEEAVEDDNRVTDLGEASEDVNRVTNLGAAAEDDNPVTNLGESEEESADNEDEKSMDEDTMVEAMNNVLVGLMEDAEEEAINLKTSMVMAEDIATSPSPQRSAHGCSPVDVVEREGEGEGEVEMQEGAAVLEELVFPQGDGNSSRAVGSFSSGIPPTPGRGYAPFDTSLRSEEQEDVQPMEESEGDGRPQSAEDPQLEAIPATRSTSKPSARKKVKAPRKGRSTLRPPTVGEQSTSSEAMEHSGLDREVQYGQVADVDEAIVDIIMEETARGEGTSTDLNVSSPVEEVAAAVLEVAGQGRAHRDQAAVEVAEEPTTSEAELVMRKQVICLDSDDDMPPKVLDLDVKVKVRDRVPRRVRGTFADYMTDDSEDEDYGMPGYNRVKLNFVTDPHPVLAGRPDTGKDADGKDKVHFAPFVDKYLAEVPENVRLNLAKLYSSYDYHRMFAYLSTPAFCLAVKVKHVLHAASLKKMRKRWIEFEAPRYREGRGHFPGSEAAQAGSVVDSTLEIIDVSGMPESPRRVVQAGAAESSSPHVVRGAEAQPSSSDRVIYTPLPNAILCSPC